MNQINVRRLRPPCVLYPFLIAICLLGACLPKALEPVRGGSLTLVREAAGGLPVAPLQLSPPRQPVTLPMVAGGLLHVQAASLSAGAAGAAAVAQAAPVLLVLHGMCGDPAASCAAWSSAAPSRHWLLCPSGDVPCKLGFDWSPGEQGRASRVLQAVSELRRGWGSWVEDRGAVLVGFSRGAFVARDVAYARPGEVRGLVLVGAAIVLQPERLERAGVRRVVLAAGDRDEAMPAMLRATAVLRRAGMEARFVSTGPIYHQLPVDLDAALGAALSWVAGS